MSGGGGWGAKQGLLSLDPQTTLDNAEHDDLESFMDSFSGKGGIVFPGSYVQFFMEAANPTRREYSQHIKRRWDPSDNAASPTVVLGTPGAALSAPPSISGVWPSLFGAVSSEGMFLKSAQVQEADGGIMLTTKIDAPRSYVAATSRFHHLLGSKVHGNVFARVEKIRQVWDKEEEMKALGDT